MDDVINLLWGIIILVFVMFVLLWFDIVRVEDKIDKIMEHLNIKEK